MGLAGFGSISWEGWEQTPPAPHSRIYPPGWSSVKVRGVLWFWGGFGLFWVGFFFFFFNDVSEETDGKLPGVWSGWSAFW